MTTPSVARCQGCFGVLPEGRQSTCSTGCQTRCFLRQSRADKLAMDGAFTVPTVTPGQLVDVAIGLNVIVGRLPSGAAKETR